MLLAIDTSTRAGSVALLGADGALVARSLSAQDQGAALAPAVEALLGPEGLARVEGYALSKGPGSFTGLRIGLAFLKGLAMVHARPAVGVSTLLVLAQGLAEAHPEAQYFLPMLDARRADVFAGLYRRGPAGLSADEAWPDGLYARNLILEGLSHLAPKIVAGGDGAGLDCFAHAGWSVAARELWVPSAAVLARVAVPRLLSEGEDPLGLELAYFQASAAEEKLLAVSRA